MRLFEKQYYIFARN